MPYGANSPNGNPSGNGNGWMNQAPPQDGQQQRDQDPSGSLDANNVLWRKVTYGICFKKF